MRIAASGFVSEQAGSVAAANALLLRALLDLGMEIDFFSKSSFVDPRPAVGERTGFRFVPVINGRSDKFRQKVEMVPILGALAGRNDSACYNRLLVRRIRDEHRMRNYDAVLWMGDYAHGCVPGVPTISFAQGPPGTDARSILRRRSEVRRLAGKFGARKWEVLARLRLSQLGLPNFRNSDHYIVGSSVSKETLVYRYHLPSERISTLPYPIDLDLFRPSTFTFPLSTSTPLRVLWLGRIVPRKRLDLFLDGAALALQQGGNLELAVMGGIGFVPGYEKLLKAFAYPERLRWVESLPRADVPELLAAHDVLVQPSEEENFGSSVAEAQACGLPVIVGSTNGNADYLCSRDLRLTDDRPETFAAALREMAARKSEGRWGEARESRQLAEREFNLSVVVRRLVAIIEDVCG